MSNDLGTAHHEQLAHQGQHMQQACAPSMSYGLGTPHHEQPAHQGQPVQQVIPVMIAAPGMGQMPQQPQHQSHQPHQQWPMQQLQQQQQPQQFMPYGIGVGGWRGDGKPAGPEQQSGPQHQQSRNSQLLWVPAGQLQQCPDGFSGRWDLAMAVNVFNQQLEKMHDPSQAAGAARSDIAEEPGAFCGPRLCGPTPNGAMAMGGQLIQPQPQAQARPSEYADWGNTEEGYNLLPYFAAADEPRREATNSMGQGGKSTRFTWADVMDTEPGDSQWPGMEEPWAQRDHSVMPNFAQGPVRQQNQAAMRNEDATKCEKNGAGHGGHSQTFHPRGGACPTRGIQLLNFLEANRQQQQKQPLQSGPTVPEGDCFPGGLQPLGALLAQQKRLLRGPEGGEKMAGPKGGNKARARDGGKGGRHGGSGSMLKVQERGQPEPQPKDQEANTMKKQLQALQAEDPATVFIVRRINKLGFTSTEILREHFSRFGPVKHVYVSHSRVKALRCMRQNKGDTWRLRAAALGFIVMKHPESTELIIASGPELVVQGVTIRVFRFESWHPRTADEADEAYDSDAEKEDVGESPKQFLEGVGDMMFADSCVFGGTILHAGQPAAPNVMSGNGTMAYSEHDLKNAQPGFYTD